MRDRTSLVPLHSLSDKYPLEKYKLSYLPPSFRLIVRGAFNKLPDFIGIRSSRRLMKIQYVIAIHLMRWLTNFFDFRFKWTATTGIGIHPTKSWLSQLVNIKNAIWSLKERYAIKFCFIFEKMPCNENWIYCYDPGTKRQSSQLKHAGSPRPKKARQSKSTHKRLMIPFFDSTDMIYMHWVPTGQTVNEEYYVEVLREFRKRFRRKWAVFFISGQWHLHQDNAPVTIPSLSQTIWQRWASR